MPRSEEYPPVSEFAKRLRANLADPNYVGREYPTSQEVGATEQSLILVGYDWGLTPKAEPVPEELAPPAEDPRVSAFVQEVLARREAMRADPNWQPPAHWKINQAEGSLIAVGYNWGTRAEPNPEPPAPAENLESLPPSPDRRGTE